MFKWLQRPNRHEQIPAEGVSVGDILDPPSQTQTIATLRESLAQSLRDFRQLRDKNEDLSAQNEELRKGRVVTEQEQTEIQRQVREHTAMLADMAEIALYLRENYKAEISRGDHQGKTLPQVIIMYLARERAMNGVKQ